jgi:hypothetical protein
VKSTKKLFDSEDERVIIKVLINHVSLDDANVIQYSKTIVDVQIMDIPHEKDEQFTTEMSRSDATLVQEKTMELK